MYELTFITTLGTELWLGQTGELPITQQLWRVLRVALLTSTVLALAPQVWSVLACAAGVAAAVSALIITIAPQHERARLMGIARVLSSANGVLRAALPYTLPLLPYVLPLLPRITRAVHVLRSWRAYMTPSPPQVAPQTPPQPQPQPTLAPQPTESPAPAPTPLPPHASPAADTPTDSAAVTDPVVIVDAAVGATHSGGRGTRARRGGTRAARTTARAPISTHTAAAVL